MSRKNKRTNIEIDVIVSKTVDYLIENKIIPCNLVDTYRGENTLWGQLCSKIFGVYEFVNSLYIRTLWTRNTKSFRTRVMDQYRLKKSSSAQKVILLTDKDKKKIRSFIMLSKTQNRRRFNTSFCDFVSKKLQVLGILCWLKYGSNWFRKEDGRKRGDFWNGIFPCIECNNSFRLRINSPTFDEIIVDLVNYKQNHQEFVDKRKKRIVGEKRKLLAEKIKSMGITNFRAENEIISSQPIDYKTIRKISSEFTHRYKFFNEIRADADATKLSFDLLLPQTIKNGVIGFIQEIAISPFSMTFYSEIQVRMWETIKQRYPVWHFDASGLFLKEILDQKKPLLYSIVSYDPIAKSLIPIADFFSTANDTINISINLLRIYNAYKKYNINFNPSIIVTDFSWANINALLKTFLNCEIIQYLKMCFGKAVLKDDSFSKNLTTKIYICATHFLKNIIDDVDDIKITKEKIPEKVRAAFIYCFSMLQNSTTIEEFNKNLLDTINIFCQPNFNQSLLKSLVRMNIEISIRNIDWLCQLFKNFDRRFLISPSDEKELLFSNNFSNNYIKDSPFTLYFKERIDALKESIEVESKKAKNLKKNEFFKPVLIRIIEKRLHLVPLWSGIMIFLEKENFPNLNKTLSRLTNNSVESWFGYFRNHVLDINKRLKTKRRLLPSEIIIPYYNYLSMKFKQFYEKDCIDFSKKKNETSEVDNNNDFENWKSKFEKPRKENGIYYSKNFNFKYDEITKNLNLKPVLNESSQLFSIPLIEVEETEVEEKKYIDYKEHVYFYFEYEKISCKIIYDLLNDDLLSDEVIHTYLKIVSEDYNIRIFDYFSTSKIFDDTYVTENFLPNEDLSAYSIISGLIHDSRRKHWCLFFVDVENQSFSFIDSFGEAKNDVFHFERWKLFSNYRKEFKDKKWNLRKIRHPIQNDGVNCGVFVCMFFKKLLITRKDENDLNLYEESPYRYRKIIFDEFYKENIKFVNNVVLCCACGKKDAKAKLIGFNCIHSYHPTCLNERKCEQCEIIDSLYDKFSMQD